MSRVHAVFLDYATVDGGDLDPAPLRSAVDTLALHDHTSDEQIGERIAAADVVIVNKARLDAQRIAAAPRLALICLAATGTNNIDLDAARKRRIGVANIRGYCTASVVQHVFASILTLTHRLADYQRRLAEGAWRDAAQFTLLDFPIRELTGRRLGIVGYGELGRGVARAGECFGMRIVIANRPGGERQAGRLDLDELLAQSDVVSLHCPLTAHTRGLIGARELDLMRPDALLVNTARGALIDSAALAGALRGGRLGGAAIDVLAQEPPVDGDALLAADIPQLIVTPHIAWAAREARQRALDEIAANIAAFRAGERRGRVV